MTDHLNRRDWLKSAAAAAGVAALPVRAAAEPATMEPFGYCLNTSTLRGQNIPIDKEVEIASRAGYTGIEPWIRELEEYVKNGGTLKDLGKMLADSGLKVESAIGFAEWIADDEAKRKKGLEVAKRDMEMVLAIGGKRIAAPPAGAQNERIADLNVITERYRALADIGKSVGVIPEVELWGFSKTLHRLGEVVYVAIESGYADACILPDVYHLYKGGSDPAGLRLLQGSAIGIVHMNDYPTTIGREKITDAERVYPGDGGAPLKQILRTLRDIGYRGMLSLELFNREYWKQDALAVAKMGLEKMKAAVKAAMG
jgi:sugar phosphate isomerase/epimerase